MVTADCECLISLLSHRAGAFNPFLLQYRTGCSCCHPSLNPWNGGWAQEGCHNSGKDTPLNTKPSAGFGSESNCSLEILVSTRTDVGKGKEQGRVYPPKKGGEKVSVKEQKAGKVRKSNKKIR